MVEPWLSPEVYRVGALTMHTADEGVTKLAWMYSAAIEEGRSVFDIHHLLGTSAGVEHFVEKHSLGLFTQDEYARRLRRGRPHPGERPGRLLRIRPSHSTGRVGAGSMDHHDIVASCEGDFDQHGDTFRGAGWTKSEAEAERRYDVMLDLVADIGEFTLLDFGCGSARLLDHAIRSGVAGMDYSGLDLSQKVIDVCRTKHPDRQFDCR